MEDIPVDSLRLFHGHGFLANPADSLLIVVDGFGSRKVESEEETAGNRQSYSNGTVGQFRELQAKHNSKRKSLPVSSDDSSKFAALPT